MWRSTIILINILYCSHFAFCELADKQGLKAVVVLFRHGDRAPTISYPNDPYFDEKYWPMGLGQLTNQGKRRQYHLGRWLRSTYRDFLPEMYFPNDIYVFSTDMDRTLMSAASNLAGLYPPKDSQKWNDELNWQPIPIHTAPRNKDIILNQDLKCPKHDELFNELSKCEFFININKKYSHLYEQLSNFTGWNVNNTYYFSIIFSTFHAYSHHNASYIPSWYYTLDQNATEYLAALQYIKSSFTPELSRLSGGVFFYKLFQHFDNIINGTDGVKLLMYSGHDDTIARILNIMNVFDYKIPDYASMVIWEFYHKDDKYYINLLYKKNDTYVEKLKLNVCEFDCEYSLFKRYLEHIILLPHDQKHACSVKN